ncbi:Reticulocyte-binding protein 2 homolog a [Geodia barretti]|uniref:Reticulocyte-binding protein 2 homolog a n=2 Tax=Geodia barretti TaxID=519541 RepID=A0AA35QSY2_GEOBA|nr:Reticulocyte-binding protein 2 homolog a [Geodia barretti]
MDGGLNAAEFSVAMCLVHRALNGVAPPPLLPPPLAESIETLLSGTLPPMDDRHVLKCQTAFAAFKACIVTGRLGLEATKYLFSKTNLSAGQLFQIWRLSDRDGDGQLVFLEFVLAMHLVFLAKLSHVLPLTLDPSSLLHPLYYKIVAEAREMMDETPPTPKPVSVTSDLFPPPTVPLEDGPEGCSLSRPFTDEILHSLTPENDSLSLQEPDPFSSLLPPPNDVGGAQLSGRSLVTNGNGEGVAMTTMERVHEVAILEEEGEGRGTVLETAHFTSVLSPPNHHLMMAEQVVIAPNGELASQEDGEEGGEEEEWADEVVEEQLIVESEEEEEETETEEQVQAELESLSLQSRQFLKESRDRLCEQQRRNLESQFPNESSGMDEYQRASVKGLRETIADMEGAELLLAKFDDIEAEIESVLELVQSEEEEEERKDDDKEKETMERGVERMGGAAHRESVTFPRTRISLPQESVEVVKREQLSPSSWRVVEERASPPPPLRKEHRSEQELEGVRMDLDSYLQSEMEDLNDMFQEFETQDQRKKIRDRDEEEKIMTKEVAEVVDEGPKVGGMEEVVERRQREGEEKERLYQEEMDRLERERLRALEEESLERKRTIDSDQTIQNLDQELQNLLSKDEEQVREAQREKGAREKREEEERLLREEQRREKATEQDMTVEEWIVWMEEKKTQGMTTGQQMEYEKRKRVWLEREKEREEKRRREEEEQIRKTRERMARDYQEFQERDQEMKANRLDPEKLQQLQEETARKRGEERRDRESKTHRKEENRSSRNLEEVELKPKVQKSALAARWEEQVRSQHNGK